MNSWIIIPARGGSKTIPRKNLALLAGRPLIDYVLAAAMAWGKADRVIVSTDDPGIAKRAVRLGRRKVHIAGRPFHLCGDDVPVAAVIEDLLNQDMDWPDIVILLQPTSPFVLPKHIKLAFEKFSRSRGAKTTNSFETITECPHNHHEYNQRWLRLMKVPAWSTVSWVHPVERKNSFNKQTKPERFVFGNLIAFRPDKFMKSKDLFYRPTRCHIIDRPYAHDVDDQFDLMMAEAMIEKGIVKLEHMK